MAPFPGGLWILAAFVGFALAGQGADTEGRTLRPAEVILERFIEVTGGRAAYERLHSRVARGRMEASDGKVAGLMTMYQAVPNKLRMRFETFEGMAIERGFDGDVVWEVDYRGQARTIEGLERASAIRLASFNAELHWPDLFENVRTVGTDLVDGRECHTVELTPKGEPAQFHFFDKATGLRVKMLVPYQIGEATVDIEMIPGEYKPADGIRLPFVTRQRLMEQDRIVALDTIVHNVPIPPEVFELPCEVKALLEERSKALGYTPNVPNGSGADE